MSEVIARAEQQMEQKEPDTRMDTMGDVGR